MNWLAFILIKLRLNYIFSVFSVDGAFLDPLLIIDLFERYLDGPHKKYCLGI